MNDAGWDVNHRPGADGLLLSIKKYSPPSLEHVVELGRALVIVEPGPIDIHGMGPGRYVLVAFAQEAVAEPAGTLFAWRFVLMADYEIPWNGGHVVISHEDIGCRRTQFVDSEIPGECGPVG